MPAYLPWETAKQYAEANELRQVIIMAWDGDRVHVVTYGATADDSEQAATGGNLMKKAIGWPDRLCDAISPRVQALRDEIATLRARLGEPA